MLASGMELWAQTRAYFDTICKILDLGNRRQGSVYLSAGIWGCFSELVNLREAGVGKLWAVSVGSDALSEVILFL